MLPTAKSTTVSVPPTLTLPGVNILPALTFPPTLTIPGVIKLVAVTTPFADMLPFAIIFPEFKLPCKLSVPEIEKLFTELLPVTIRLPAVIKEEDVITGTVNVEAVIVVIFAFGTVSVLNTESKVNSGVAPKFV